MLDDKSDINNSSSVIYVANHIKACLDFAKSYQHRGLIKKTLQKCFNFFNNGVYLTFSYLFVKICYVITIFAQIVSLNYWLRDVHYPVTHNILFGYHNWKLAERFPRMTLCKFQVYIYNDQQTQWVQCALPINIYIEKIYIGVWIWLWVLLALTIYGIFSYIFRILRRNSFLKDRMGQEKDFQRLKNYLTVDGFLSLHLIKSNTNNFYVCSIISTLYKLIEQ